MQTFTPEIARKLKYYVYLYVDPESDEVFYIGKGKGNRAFDHLEEDSEAEKVHRIREMRSRGTGPRIEILAHGLPDEASAYRVEAAAIDLLGKQRLTNQVRGWRSGTYGRMTVEQIHAIYAAEEVEITEQSVLIRINELFRYGMTPIELYDVTRGIWKLGKKREDAELAMAVFDGIVQEVYRIRAWFPAGATFSTRGDLNEDGRWEFVGAIAEEEVRKRYRYKSVRSYLAKGSQNPIRYTW